MRFAIQAVPKPDKPRVIQSGGKEYVITSWLRIAITKEVRNKRPTSVVIAGRLTKNLHVSATTASEYTKNAASSNREIGRCE